MILEQRASMKCIINEAYFGKNPLLNEMDSIFQVLIDRIDKEEQIGNRNINSMFTIKEQNKLEDIIVELFGFSKVRLTVTPDINAFTVPYTLTSTHKFGHIDVKTGRGKYGQPIYVGSVKPELLVNFGTGLISTCRMTAKECTAIILHEIGHNFSRTNKILRVMDNLKLVVSYIELYNTFNRLRKPITERNPKKKEALIQKKIKDFMEFSGNLTQLFIFTTPLANKIIDKYRKLTRKSESDYAETNVSMTLNAHLTSISSSIFNMAAIFQRFFLDPIESTLDDLKELTTKVTLLNPAANPIKAAYELLDLRFSYMDEKFSDNFATAFGYGDSVISGMSKFNKHGSMLGSSSEIFDDKVPALGFALSIVTAPITILHGLVDEHPAYITRAKDQIDMLKHQLKSDYVPDNLKNEILKDLEACNIALDNSHDNYKVQFNSKFATTLKAAFEYHVTGKDIKEFIFKRRNYDFKYLFTEEK